MSTGHTPSAGELAEFSLHAFRGVDAGLGESDPGADIGRKLAAAHPGHLVLVQAGKFLHAYDKSAYALASLKKYRLKLVGSTADPHLRVGFPAGNFRRRLWPLVAEFGIPYVVALGTKGDGRTVYVSNQPAGNAAVLDAVSDRVLVDVIAELKQRGELNQAAARQLLANPESGAFLFKARAQEMDTLMLQDILKMPRDVRAVLGENLRACLARIARGAFAYGQDEHKPALLRSLSADIDLLKHYIAQAQGLSQLKINFEHRAGLAVELGRLLGGLIKSQREQP